MAVYIFFRPEGFFYPITLRDDADARANAECNPGTVKVEDMKGRVVWAPLPAATRSRTGGEG